jgi:hypothetical protein
VKKTISQWADNYSVIDSTAAHFQPTPAVRITPTMLRVLKAVEDNEFCGANYMDSFVFPEKRHRMTLRTGQYMGRLVRRGLINRRYDSHKGRRGQIIAQTVCYSLTPLAREILKSEA